MSAIDCPPGLGLIAVDQRAFRSRRGPRRLSQLAFAVVTFCWILTWWLLSKNSRVDRATFAVLPLALLACTAVGLAVRGARIWVDRGGVRWGAPSMSFRMARERIAVAEVYRDGVSLVSTRGSRWFLAARDWDNFELLHRELGRAGIPLQEFARHAPWRARLQSYGRVLDGMLILTMASSALLLLAVV
jgi:hypothetical protein